MSETNGDVISMDELNAQKRSTVEDMLLAEIGQLERIIEKKEKEVKDRQEAVDEASTSLMVVEGELAGLRDALEEKQRALENPNYDFDNTPDEE